MSKPDRSLRLTFRHEVRPDVYIERAWLTALIVAVVWAALTVYKNGQVQMEYLLPLPFGTWHTCDPVGALYVESWTTILVNSLQAGFGIWGVVLMISGLHRAVTTQKAFLFCFSLGGAFLGFTWLLPSGALSLLKILVEQYPILCQ